MTTPNKDTVLDSVRSQLREEIGTSELKNPAKFQLEQKFGIVEPVLTEPELALIRAEGARLARG